MKVSTTLLLHVVIVNTCVSLSLSLSLSYSISVVGADGSCPFLLVSQEFYKEQFISPSWTLMEK